MLNSEYKNGLTCQLETDMQMVATFPTPEFWEKSALLKEFVNLFDAVAIQAMLLESEMQVMEQCACRWIAAISCYSDLGKLVEDYILLNSASWAGFRDVTGVMEVEIFTRPFTNPKKCITYVDLKALGGWNHSPIRYGVLPALV